jgi:hypothetical protein
MTCVDDDTLDSANQSTSMKTTQNRRIKDKCELSRVTVSPLPVESDIQKHDYLSLIYSEVVDRIIY